MPDHRLKYLFNQYYYRIDTEQESLEFQKYLQDDHYREQILQLMAEKYKHHTSNEILIDSIQQDRMLKEIYVAHVLPQKKSYNPYNHFKNWFTAALIVIVGSFSASIFFQNKNDAIKSNNITDRQPGGNNAVLTLGNGKKIVLNEANLGLVEHTDGIQVRKTSDGQLLYKIGGNSDRREIHTIETPNRGQYQVILSDGTHIWMNAASSVSFPAAFAKDKRELKMSGEVYFEVSHDSKRPFYVQVETAKVKVLGTSFNIKSYPETKFMKTTLLTGAVEVSSHGIQQQIIPGQQLQLDKYAASLPLVQAADLDAVLAWKNNFFSNGAIRLAELMFEIKRWYNVDIVFQDLINPVFVAKFPKNIPLSELLELLEMTNKVRFDFDGKTIKIKKRI